jgi:hypothetical protein
MKTISTTIFFFFAIIISGQEKYDVRKIKWGMTINEVMASEYPLIPSEKKSEQLEYLNVEIGNGQKVDISYRFKNLKVQEIKYTIYGYNAEFSKGTCSHVIPLYDKIKYTNFIFEAIRSKSMKCNIGWYIPYGIPSGFITGFPIKNCNIDKKTVEKIENATRENQSTQIALSFNNERTNATFYFNEYQNYKTESTHVLPCDDKSYNIYYWLVFSPSYNIEKETKQQDF